MKYKIGDRVCITQMHFDVPESHPVRTLINKTKSIGIIESVDKGYPHPYCVKFYKQVSNHNIYNFDEDELAIPIGEQLMLFEV